MASNRKKVKEQPKLFDLPGEWEGSWESMPEYENKDERPACSIVVHFDSLEGKDEFMAKMGYKPGRG